MSLQFLEYIIAIAEEKSLSKAAERLLISQPALSRQLKRQEEELGTPLFSRLHNQMLLTDAGRIYVNGARRILSIYYDAAGQIQKMRYSARRQLSLVYHSALLPDFSARILPVFRSEHKDVLLNTVNGNSSVSKAYVENGLADLAVIAAGESSHSLLEFLPLRDDELLLALPAGHPCVSRFQETGIQMKLLEQEPFILNQAGSHFLSMEEKILLENESFPPILCETGDLQASYRMVCDGKGIAFLPRSMQVDSNLCHRFSFSPPAVFHIVVAFHKSVILSPAAKDLIRLLLQVYGPPA